MVVIIKLQELYLRFEVDKIYWWNTKFKKLSHYAVQGGPKKADTRETVWVSAFFDHHVCFKCDNFAQRLHLYVACI